MQLSVIIYAAACRQKTRSARTLNNVHPIKRYEREGEGRECRQVLTHTHTHIHTHSLTSVILEPSIFVDGKKLYGAIISGGV